MLLTGKKNISREPEIDSPSLISKLWRQHYNENAIKHAKSPLANDYYNNGSYKLIRRSILKDIGNIEGISILDVGCGTGLFSRDFCRNNTVYGIDFAKEMASLARGNGLFSAIASGNQIPFKSHRFDLVISVGVLQCMEDPRFILQEMFRMLAPGGRIFVMTINKQSIIRKMTKILESSTKNYIFPHNISVINSHIENLGIARYQFTGLYYPFPFAIKSSPGNVVARYMCTSYYFIISRGK